MAALTEREKALFGVGLETDVTDISKHALVVLGPPGSGKSTLVKALAREDWLKPALAHLERPDENPHMQGRTPFEEINLSESQDWFLRQYEKFCAKLSREVSVLVDQDPRAVVFVYTKIFMVQGRVSTERYERQLDWCLSILRQIQTDDRVAQFVILRAPQDLLFQRLRQRPGPINFTSSLLNNVLNQFEELSNELKGSYPNCWSGFDTGKTSTEQIVSTLRKKFDRPPNRR